jgi:hypothetical protein
VKSHDFNITSSEAKAISRGNFQRLKFHYFLCSDGFGALNPAARAERTPNYVDEIKNYLSSNGYARHKRIIFLAGAFDENGNFF